jgi:hypothetical protein
MSNPNQDDNSLQNESNDLSPLTNTTVYDAAVVSAKISHKSY